MRSGQCRQEDMGSFPRFFKAKLSQAHPKAKKKPPPSWEAFSLGDKELPVNKGLG